jgi:hypothetical protein
MENIIETLSTFLSDNDIDTEDFAYLYIDESLLEGTVFEGIKEVRNERVGSDFDTSLITLYLPKVDKYIEISGYYSSHGGTDLSGEDFYEVKKETKIVEIIEYNQI